MSDETYGLVEMLLDNADYFGHVESAALATRGISGATLKSLCINVLYFNESYCTQEGIDWDAAALSINMSCGWAEVVGETQVEVNVYVVDVLGIRHLVKSQVI